MTSESMDNNTSTTDDVTKQENNKDQFLGSELWTDGLLCAFEYIKGNSKTLGSINSIDTSKIPVLKSQPTNPLLQNSSKNHNQESYQETEYGCSSEISPGNYWIPIGWNRISELLNTVQIDTIWETPSIDLEGDITVADVVGPYWKRPVGPTWWAHVNAGHPFINSWLSNAQWLHPEISTALREESKLISERMRHLLYEVPVRVADGLLFELLGQSVGDPFLEEEDVPVVIRSWQAQNFLLTALHVKGSSSSINVLGVSEVQDMLAAGGKNIPRTIHEVIALLASRLARWDDRLSRKFIFGGADEVELKFVNRTRKDMHLYSIILNQEIRRLSTQVIRVKWSLHAREEIIFELLHHLRGNGARNLLQKINKSTRKMIQEQEAVRARLFTIQDVMQSTVRARLQDQSLRVQHNLGVFAGCGLVLSIITGLFGINVDGMPGAKHAPCAFAVFSGALFLLGGALIAIGLVYLGLKKPLMEEKAQVRKLELQELVKMFEQEAESHTQVRKTSPKSAKGLISEGEKFVVVE